MQYKFNILDNEFTQSKETSFASRYGYEALVRQGEAMVPNPETRKNFCERMLKKIFLEPWITDKAQLAYQAELNNLGGD